MKLRYREGDGCIRHVANLRFKLHLSAPGWFPTALSPCLSGWLHEGDFNASELIYPIKVLKVLTTKSFCLIAALTVRESGRTVPFPVLAKGLVSIGVPTHRLWPLLCGLRLAGYCQGLSKNIFHSWVVTYHKFLPTSPLSYSFVEVANILIMRKTCGAIVSY